MEEKSDGDRKLITGVHHAAIIVSSLQSLRFYEALGFKEVLRKKRRYDTVVLMDGYGFRLEVFVDARHSQRGDIEPYGFRHLALKVDDLKETMEELKDLTFGPMMEDWTGEKFCFTTDPDGTVVELHE